MIRASLSAASLFAMGLACAMQSGCRTVNDPAAAVQPLPTRSASTSDHSDAHWTGWRGASRHGVVDDPQVAIQWTPSEGVRWKASVPGKGNSSPVVWGDRVFLTSLVEENSNRRLALLCFRREDGALLWQKTVGAPLGATHIRNGHASATPAVDAQRVFVSFGPLGLFCFSHDGDQRWNTSPLDCEHEWGSAASPVLYRNLVIQLCDSRRDSYLAAYDKATGDEVWRTPRQSTGCWTTPVLLTVGAGGSERDELIVNGTGASNGSRGLVIAYDPQTGRELWRVRGTTDIPCPTLIVGQRLVYSTSGGNGPVLAIKPGGSGDVTGTHVAWRHSTGGPYVPTGVAYQGRLYTIADSGTLRCYDASDGSELWKRRLRGTFAASLIAAGGRIYAASEQGQVHVLAASDKFESLAVNAMSQPCFATPAVAEGELLLRTDRSLFCIAPQPLALADESKSADESGDAAKFAVGEESSPSDAGNADLPVATKHESSPSDEQGDDALQEPETPRRDPAEGGSPRATPL